MIAFGYEKDNDEEKLMKLSETTLQCNNEELDRIIDFLNRIKNTNYEAGDHYHYRDFNKKWTSEESDFIIFLEEDGLNHKFCGISDSSRSSVGSYRIASERNIRHQDIRIPVCEES